MDQWITIQTNIAETKRRNMAHPVPHKGQIEERKQSWFKFVLVSSQTPNEQMYSIM